MNLVYFIYRKVTFPSLNDQRLSAQATDTKLINMSLGARLSRLFSERNSPATVFLLLSFPDRRGDGAGAPAAPAESALSSLPISKYKNE